jgi:hypothetical protein
LCTSRILWTELSRHGKAFHEVTIRVLIFVISISNIFVIGEGTKPWISLPKGKGTKLTISEERDVRRRQRAAEQ